METPCSTPTLLTVAWPQFLRVRPLAKEEAMPPIPRRLPKWILQSAAVFCSLIALSSPRADMTLTPAAVCRGFTLVSYASDFVANYTGAIGPLGVAYIPNNEVLITFLDQPTLT